MLPSRLDCPLSLKTPNMGNPGSLVSRTEALARADRRGDPNQSRLYRWMSGGLEPCRCSRPVRDDAPQSLPQSSAVTGSRPPRPGRRAHRIADCAFWSDRLMSGAPDSKESSPRPSMRPTSWGSARNRRARTGREAVAMAGGSPLSTLPAGTTEAQVDDMMMVLEVADEATPAPNRPRPDRAKTPHFPYQPCRRAVISNRTTRCSRIAERSGYHEC